jgi:membrane protease YdiL (CAAX protease family)
LWFGAEPNEWPVSAALLNMAGQSGSQLLFAITSGSLCAALSATLALKWLLLAPVVEELFFRTLIQRWLLTLSRGRWQWWGISAANAVTAALFSAAHLAYGGLTQAILVAAPGLLLGVVYEKTSRVIVCMALHAAMNFIWMGVICTTSLHL